MLFVAFIALVVRLVGGFVMGVYRGGPYLTDRAPEQPQQTFENQASMAEVTEKVSALEQEVSSNPKNVVAWTQLGDLYFRNMAQYHKAIEAYEKSLELNPKNTTVWTTLGIAYRRTREFVKALEAYERAAKIDPRHEASRFNKGVVLMYDMGDRERAVQAWEELLRTNPAAMAPGGEPVKDLLERVIREQNQQESP